MQIKADLQGPRSSKAGKYLSFLLGAEEYAIEVLKVREIVKSQHITPVPDAPASVKGVINLRGKVIPVIDLRLKFGLPEKAPSERTCIVVVQLQFEMAELMGLIVDEMCEVLTLQEADVQDIPILGRGVQTHYLLGIARTKDRLRILLDIDAVVASTERQVLAEVQPA